MNGIQDHEAIEGNLKAVKDTSDFGGPNMWRLHVKNTKGRWESVQWMHVSKIKHFFNRELPVYQETISTNYKLQNT
jgi:hypothetical protein